MVCIYGHMYTYIHMEKNIVCLYLSDFSPLYYLSIYRSIYLSIFLFGCLFIYRGTTKYSFTIYLLAYLYIHLSITIRMAYKTTPNLNFFWEKTKEREKKTMIYGETDWQRERESERERESQKLCRREELTTFIR